MSVGYRSENKVGIDFTLPLRVPLALISEVVSDDVLLRHSVMSYPYTSPRLASSSTEMFLEL